MGDQNRDTGSSGLKPVSADSLCWRCESGELPFETTDDLDELDEILGQERAMDAIHFGIDIQQAGYNLFVLGPSGIGKRSAVHRFVAAKAASGPEPKDWCYVCNFDQHHKPLALTLPKGRGKQLRDAMDDLCEQLRSAVPAALESDEYRTRLNEFKQEFEERQEAAFKTVSDQAEEKGIRLIRTPSGFALAPTHDGDVLSPEDFEKLPADEQDKIEEAVKSLQGDLQKVIEKVPEWRRETNDKIKELNREVTQFAIGHSLENVQQQFTDLPRVSQFLEAVERDVIEHADDFHPRQEEPLAMLGLPVPDRPSMRNYRVNLLVDNRDTEGAPVVVEDHPAFHNLLGRLDHRSQMGSLMTDFTMIKAGSLHRANGGFLVIEALKLLRQPFAWEAFKRALSNQAVKIESLGEALSLVSTVSLEPEPIPLDVKIILLGDRFVYYLLHELDAEFAELFKVAADFDEEIDISVENCVLFARLLAAIARREKLRPFDRAGVGRVLEHAARLAGDSTKLSTHMRSVADVMREADHWADGEESPRVTGHHVQKAIDQRIYRSDRLQKRLQEEIVRETILIDTAGERVGQVNGLSVIELGGYRFGRPSRITATVRLGRGEVIDIEREVELGGAIHSKGVYILSSFLAARYGKDRPMSLTAHLVFEQSYGHIEGDSASAAELCALLSALGDVPIKQSMAVTGSVNQHGQVQAIGGVNEKIEGFFDLCHVRGLSGSQAVIIPASNVKHLMLRHDVVAAAAAGQFGVYPVATIDEAISLLTGLDAGQPDDSGKYPTDTLNYRVDARLQEWADLRKQLGQPLRSDEQD